jgi:hypothetical protein
MKEIKNNCDEMSVNNSSGLFLQEYRDRLASGEDLSNGDILNILNLYERSLKDLAYAASCNAATIERLPKSSSKYQRKRFEVINERFIDSIKGNYIGGVVKKNIDIHSDEIFNSFERCVFNKTGD